jgi:hypothetical protein
LAYQLDNHQANLPFLIPSSPEYVVFSSSSSAAKVDNLLTNHLANQLANHQSTFFLII